MYDPATIEAELAVQRGINPTNATSRTSLRDFAVNVQQFRVYLAMLGGQPHVTMIHTPRAYYSSTPLLVPTRAGCWLSLEIEGLQRSPTQCACPQQRPGSGFPAMRWPTLQPLRTTLPSRQAAASCGCRSQERITLGPYRYHTWSPSPTSPLTCYAHRGWQSRHTRSWWRGTTSLPLACTPLANNESAFGNGASWRANPEPTGRARSSWKQAPSLT